MFTEKRFARLLLLPLALSAFTAHATEPQTKRDTQGFAGACQAASAADDARITRGPLFGSTKGLPAAVVCSPVIDTSQNGARAFGVTFSNTSTTTTRTITCTAQISTIAAGPQKFVTHSVMVSPRAHGTIDWTSRDVAEGKTFIGGQVGFTCTLPPFVALSNVWTESVGN